LSASSFELPDDGDAPHGIGREDDGVLDPPSLDGGHAALTVERIGDGERNLQGVALTASRRTDVGFRARYAGGVVEHPRHVGRIDAATVVGDGDTVGGDGDRNLGSGAVGLGVVNAIVGELLGDHQRPAVGAVAGRRR
jgi:hypothetical protein